MLVPCGKCPRCLKRRRDEWLNRCLAEARHSESTLFVTLTYDPWHLPHTKNGVPCVCKRDLQLFLKRLRKSIEPYKIRYYGVSEYGENFGRPHYHLLVYNFPWSNFEPLSTIEKAWSCGIVDVVSAEPPCIGYVTRYCLAQHRHDLSLGRVPGFMLCSKRPPLGAAWYDSKKLHRYLDASLRPFDVHDGKKCLIPRYFLNKHFEGSSRLVLFNIERRRYFEQHCEDFEKNSCYNLPEPEDYVRVKNECIAAEWRVFARLARKHEKNL